MELCRMYSIPNGQFQTRSQVLESKGYILGPKIGSGGYGIVHLIERSDDNHQFACKILDLKENVTKHFRSELLVMFGCSKHQNIINLIDQWIINDRVSIKAYIVMEYADGGTLSELVSKCPLTESVAKDMFVQIYNGLIHLHQHKIAHRDLKLDNLLLVKSDKGVIVKITDFGLARRGFLESDSFAGTRQYMAPEIIQIRVFNEFKEEWNFKFNVFKSDIWALGICLFEMITGVLPFTMANYAEILQAQQERQYTYPRPDKVSTECKDIISNLLDPCAESRLTPFEIKNHPWISTRFNN